MVDLPNTMVHLPNTIVDLSNTMVDIPNTVVDLPNTMVDLPNFIHMLGQEVKEVPITSDYKYRIFFKVRSTDVKKISYSLN